MQNRDPGSGQQQAEMNVGSEASDAFRREAQSARETLHDARDEVARKAQEFASDAKSAAMEQAQTAQRDVGASLVAFGGALRAAGDHLAGSDQGAASQVVRQAADGIERFAGSLKNRPFADVIEDVRSFGRENSGILFAGSLLAGLALGRLVKSSAPAAHPAPSRPETSPRGQEPEAGLSGRIPASDQDFPSGPQEPWSGPVTRSSGYE
jgi:hypothetical protein